MPFYAGLQLCGCEEFLFSPSSLYIGEVDECMCRQVEDIPHMLSGMGHLSVEGCRFYER